MRTIADCGLRIADWRMTALAALGVLVGATAQGQTSLSIYRDGRVLVRRSFAEPLRQGVNQITITADGLDPATLFSTDPGVTVTSAVARYPSTAELALGRAVGQTISFARERDTVRATVVRVNPPQVRLADGRMVLQWPGTPLFPEALVRTTTQADVVLDAARGRPRADLAFVGQGMTWEAVYQVVLAGGTAGVTGMATVTSQTMRVDTASVQVVAGSIRRARRGRADTFEPQAMRVQAGLAAEADAYAAEEAVGEAHVYSLPGLITLEPGVPVATSLFPRASTTVSQEFIVPGALPWRGYVGGEQNQVRPTPVQSWYTLRRGRGSPFGDRPLPGGTVQLYQADTDGRPQLVGEAAIDHTPAGRDLRVQSGDAFDLTAERVQTEYSVEQLPPARRGLPATQRVTASYRVTLTSAKAEAVTVDVREVHAGEWRVTASSVRSEKLSSSEVRFRVPVPGNGTATLTYTVQIDS
jgi:hypothetical protein